MAKIRVGIDIGGTFTDIGILDEETGEVHSAKVLSTVDDPSKSVKAAFDEVLSLGYEPKDVTVVIHATTVATNALLESKGARSSLLLTKGFKAVPEVGDQTRDQRALYDLDYQRPRLLIPQKMMMEVDERVDSRGAVVHALTDAEITRVVSELVRDRPESVAISFLFSFLHPKHEQAVAEAIRRNVEGCEYVSVSSDVLPQIREYPRTSTVMVDAYVGPVLNRYLDGLQKGMKELGITPQPYIVHSGGGMMTAGAAKKKAVWCIESGPAAGLITATNVGTLTGNTNLFAFDMGGTTAKFGVISNGEPLVTTQFRHAGQRIAIPVLDLVEIGSGGGSIAWIDGSGLPRVGPKSAGSDPGPSCYGRGGTHPTVTDADLVLGYLDAAYFLGGRIRLSPEDAAESIRKDIAGPLGLDVTGAALGIAALVNIQMSEALRMASIERGCDPRDFTLAAFGGAGPIHAARLAEEVGVRRILIPALPGVATAVGLTTMDVKLEYSVTHLGPLAAVSLPALESKFEELESAAIEEMREQGFIERQLSMRRFLDVRYRGQGYELRVPVESEITDEEGLKELRRRFDSLHEATYGMKAEREEVEIVNYRLVSRARLAPSPRRLWGVQGSTQSAVKGHRKVCFEDQGDGTDCLVYDRSLLPAGAELSGPAMVEQADTTTVLPHSWLLKVDRYGNLIVERQDARS